LIRNGGETPESLLQKSLETSDRHLRVRLMALYFVAMGNPAIVAASKVGKHRISVAEWVHKFNTQGVESLVSQWKGNPGRILNDQELKKLKEVVCHHPREVGINKCRWTADYIMTPISPVSLVKIEKQEKSYGDFHPNVQLDPAFSSY